ncbi:MAG TPA: chromosomal replication initiator protein DnaA [Thermoleophilaceae bacterium]|nr:chromosomal replication initiator protein DnaA [Thermoleophilaceae bacterium]
MPVQIDQLWDDILEELRSETPDFKFHIWIEPLELAAVLGKTLYVRAPEHIRTSVAERYLPLLRRAAVKRFDRHALIEVVGPSWSAPAHPEASPDGVPCPDAPRGERLNPKYSFDQFVIGEGNRFAHAASLAVAELPAQAYNPLFLHGRPGIGKTHLLHAIGNYVQRYDAGLRVRYATIEEFTTGFVDAIRRHRTGDFKDDFRTADVVLIDDVQFLAGRDKTREEFFHTFNALLDNGRQLVISSDRSPEDLPGLEDRLAERFRAGLVVELEPPPADLRRAILAKRARLDGLEVPAQVLNEIAMRIDSSVRALEGALIRVVAYASLKGEDPTPSLVRHVLRRLGEDTEPDACGLSEIVDAAAQEFGVAPDSLLARDRRPAVATARQVAMYLARELTEHSLPEIGRGIGGRNHTTVLHAVNRVSAALRTDPAVRKAVDNLHRRLGRSG